MPWGKNDYYTFLLILLIIVLAGIIAAYFLGALSPDGIINFLPQPASSSPRTTTTQLKSVMF